MLETTHLQVAGPEADYGNATSAREAARSRSYNKTISNIVAADQSVPIVLETTGCMGTKAKGFFGTM